MKIRVNHNKVSLKWRIFGFLLGFCAILLTILWVFQTVFLNDIYKMIRKRELDKSISYVEKNINTADLKFLLRYISINNDIIITHSREFEVPDQFSPGVLGQPPKGGDWKHRIPEELTKVREFTLEDGTQISLTFYALITPVNATVTTLRYQLYVITGIMIVLSIGLAFIIARRVSKPIEEINRSAKELARGDYSIQFSGKGFLEIAELSETLNKTARELNTVESLRRELLANISHDLRTPLSLIYSYAEVMHDFPEEITQEQTQIIMDEVRRLSSLVNDVFDISRLESGSQPLELSAFNLTRCLQMITQRVDKLVKKDGYQITFTADQEVIVVADEIKIMQVFYNLLLNAINYSGTDKAVQVKQLVTDTEVKMEVADHGEGIAPESFPYIWDRYYKVDKKHKRAVTGTGLGLSIVKRVIELHQGDYGVDSELGKGSSFWFVLRLPEACPGMQKGRKEP